MAIFRIVLGFLLAAATTTALASFFHTQMVIKGLEASGADVALAMRLAMSADDLAGLAPQFGVVISIALALGFFIAALLRRMVKPLAGVAYPLAGAAAVGFALFVMSLAFDGITPIAGARSPLGFLLQCLAGGVGGLVFAMIAIRRTA